MEDDRDGWRQLEDDTFVALLGPVRARDVEDGVEIALEGGAHLRNLSGAMHGGVLMTLLDRAGGMAVRGAAAGSRVATASIAVSFLRPVRPEEPVTIRARLRKGGRSAHFVDAEAWAGGRLVATAQALYLRTGGDRRSNDLDD